MATSANAISRHLAVEKNGVPWIGDVPYPPNHRFAELIKAAWFESNGDATAQCEKTARLGIVSYNPSDMMLLKDPKDLYLLIQSRIKQSRFSPLLARDQSNVEKAR